MSIIDLQRQFRTLGRIRTGDKQKTSSGKLRPAKLDNFRLTSISREVLESAARVYGGDVVEWQAGPNRKEWELYLPTDSLDVLIPPQAATQWYELWTGGGCVRRCDGVTEMKNETDCVCDPENRDCKPTTRLNVVLPNVADVGVWMLESHGIYAAREIPMTLSMIQMFREQAGFTKATLRLEQRERKTVTRGKAETRKFAVPVIELRDSLEELVSAPVVPLASIELPALPPAREVEAVNLEGSVSVPVSPDSGAPPLHAAPAPTLRESQQEAMDTRHAEHGSYDKSTGEIISDSGSGDWVARKKFPQVEYPKGGGVARVVGLQDRIDAPPEAVTLVDWKALSTETGKTLGTLMKWARSHELAGVNPPSKLQDVTGPLALAIVEMARAANGTVKAVEQVQEMFPGTEVV